jgi:hypothetical protein
MTTDETFKRAVEDEVFLDISTRVTRALAGIQPWTLVGGFEDGKEGVRGAGEVHIDDRTLTIALGQLVAREERNR